jgi:hypothetical protein
MSAEYPLEGNKMKKKEQATQNQSKMINHTSSMAPSMAQSC